VIYVVPDDIAARFDCESRLALADPKKALREYGNYFGATFYINAPGGQGYSLALLWARDGGFWKIVSWQAEPEGDDTPSTERAPDVRITRVKADASFVQATRTFLESWLIRKNYDEAFGFVSPRSYACYNVGRAPEEPAATSPEDAAQKIRVNLERAGDRAGNPRSLDALIEGIQPVNPAVRVMDHQDARAFSLSSVPTAIADAVDCAARARGDRISHQVPPEYGKYFGMSFRLRTQGGEAPVMRTVWMKEGDSWRIQAYDVEVP
jgi:hypothetical protein